MPSIKLGRVDYICYLPVFYALENNLLPVMYNLVKGSPARLSDYFFRNRLQVSSIAPIEYAEHYNDCIILPGISINASGKVAKALLFSKVPVTEPEVKQVYFTTSSATSLALLKILFEHYYHVDAQYRHIDFDLERMLQKGDAALLTGDQALLGQHLVKERGLPVYVTDLGEVWHEFTGEKMVYALWVVKRSFAEDNPEIVRVIVELLHKSREIGLKNIPKLLGEAQGILGLPLPVLENYFNTINYYLDKHECQALMTFFDYAYKSGLVGERIQLKILGQDSS